MTQDIDPLLVGPPISAGCVVEESNITPIASMEGRLETATTVVATELGTTDLQHTAPADPQSTHMPFKDIQNAPDDSGVALHTDVKINHVTVAPSHAINASLVMEALKQGYKSPQLVAEDVSPVLPSDVYSIVRVRDAVESLDSEHERSADHTLVSSETFAAVSPHSARESQSSEPYQERLFDAIDETENNSDDEDDREVISEGYAETTQVAYERTRRGKRHDTPLLSSDGHSSDKPSSVAGSDTFFPDDVSDHGSGVNSPQEVPATPLKRGKKRAQEEDSAPLLVREEEGDQLSEEELFKDVGLRNIHPSRVRKLSGRTPPAAWLHPVFHVGDEDLTPKPLRYHLELLRHAIQEVAGDLQAYRRLFTLVFGPVICWNREMEVIESVNKVMELYGDRSEEFLKASHQHYAQSPARLLMSEDHFIYRYLSSFDTFSGFIESNTLLASMCSVPIMREMHHRMAMFNGGMSETGYEYWAKARAQRLHKNDDRPLHVDELRHDARKDWIEMLEQCSTVQETIDATERFFGPLRPIHGFPTPYVDIARYWNTCECGICQRTHKRARVEENVATVDVSDAGTVVSS